MKSSYMIFDRHANLKYKYGNRKFWCRGYYVDTVGKNAKKAIIDANGVLKPLKKGTITVKCTISDGKNVLKKTIKVSVKLPK